MNIDVHTENFHIRTVVPDDKSRFMGVRSVTSDMAKAYEQYPDFLDYNWEILLKDKNEISMVAFREIDGKFVATCSFQDFQGKSVDIGYDVVKEFRGQGIGTALVKDITALAHGRFPGKDVLIRVRKENTASRRVAEKCGGVFIGTEQTPEARIMMEKIPRFSSGGNGKDGYAATDQIIKHMQEIAERGKEGVLIYRLP